MKLFAIFWATNYGERVALVWAKTATQARNLVEDVWDGYEIQEVPISKTPEVVFVRGGN